MKPITTLKISISGVRGVPGESLTPQLVVRFAQSFGTYVRANKVVIGRDTRTSGEMINCGITAGLLAAGCEVIDLGIVPIPTVQLAVNKFKAGGGIGITASHNPAQWNALKFISSEGIFLTPYQAQELLDIYHQGEYKNVESEKIKKAVKDNSAVNYHLEKIFDLINVKKIKSKKFKVAIDPCGGAGTFATEKFLKKLNCKVFAINNKPTGIFPHPPEPVAQNLSQLQKLTLEKKCDIGFAQDADADRLAVCLNSGEIISEENTICLAVLASLKKHSGENVVVNLSTTSAVEEIAQKFKSKVFRSKVGEINVVEKMQLVKAVIGGEGGGGVIYPALHYARDSFIAIALILELLAEENKNITQIISSFPKKYLAKEKINLSTEKIDLALRQLKEKYKTYSLNLEDGLRIKFASGFAHIRPSNTEPVMRIIVEDENEIKMKKNLQDIKKEINKITADN